MESLKSIVAAFLLVILTASFMLFQWGLIFNMTFMQSEYYDQVFESQQFYGQVRQSILRVVKNTLPDSQESLPYLEKALTEDWIREQVPEFLEGLFAFFKGEEEDLPRVPFASLQKRLVDAIDMDISEEAKQQLISYWFPTYEEIRIQDFASTDLLWRIRELYPLVQWLPWAALGLALLVFFMIMLVDYTWRSAVLWCGAASAAGGAAAIALGVAVIWGLNHSSFFMDLISGLIAQGIPEESAEGIVWAFIKGFTRRLNTLAFVMVLLGGAFIHFAPIKEKNLSLIK